MGDDGQLSFASAHEVRQTAAFWRRNGTTITDERALAEALEELLAANDHLREGRHQELEDARAECDKADAALSCTLTGVERDAAKACRSDGEDDCAECRLAALRREHTAALAASMSQIAELSGRAEKADARHAEETRTLRARLDFVTSERDRFLVETQQREAPPPPTARRAPKRTKAPPPGQIPLFGMPTVTEAETPTPVESRPKPPRGPRKPRSGKRWLDSKAAPPPKPKRKPKAVSA